MDFDKIATITEYIDRMYPNVSRNMKEDLAKDLMFLSENALYNLKYAMDKDDGMDFNG